MINTKRINKFGVVIVLSGILLAVGFHEWLALIALIIGTYAGSAISYSD